MEFFNFFLTVFLDCKYSIAKNFNFVKLFLKFFSTAQLVKFLTTLILKHIFESLSSIFLLFLSTACFWATKTQLKYLIFLYRLDIQAGHGRQGRRDRLNGT
jgi:hypothetical protein